MLRDELERSVWASVYAKMCDVTGCYSRAMDWAREQKLPEGGHRHDLVNERWRYEEMAITSQACKMADAAILRLRRHAILNQEVLGTPHIILAQQYLTDEGELDWDVELEEESDE